ncbi:hypothetical protein ACVXHB_03245 [Escherichia coli]
MGYLSKSECVQLLDALAEIPMNGWPSKSSVDRGAMGRGSGTGAAPCSSLSNHFFKNEEQQKPYRSYF